MLKQSNMYIITVPQQSWDGESYIFHPLVLPFIV
jgi:hypothetical protein